MALMLATADVSFAGILALVILGIVNAAIIRMIVTTIKSSIRVNPRWRLLLRIATSTFLVSVHTGPASAPVLVWSMKAGHQKPRRAPADKRIIRQAQSDVKGWTPDSSKGGPATRLRLSLFALRHKLTLPSRSAYSQPENANEIGCENRRWRGHWRKAKSERRTRLSARQRIPRDLQAVEIAQDRHGNEFGLEEFVSRGEDIFLGYGLD